MASVASVDAWWPRLRALDERRPWVLDAVLASLLVLGAVVVTATGPAPRRDPLTYALLVAGGLPYVARRRAPLAVLVAASVPVAVLLVIGASSAVIGSGLFLAAYTVAAWSGPRATAVAGAYAAALLVLLAAGVPARMGVAELATNAALFAGALAVGVSSRQRRRTAALLADRALLAERARTEEARRAVADERLRIAQELHDVVGHSLGVIALQAGVGAHVLDADPAEARSALDAVARTSRTALAEIRRVLTVLRDDADLPYQPPPGLDAVPVLAAEMAAAGVPVAVRVEGAAVGMPAALGLTGYRIVQEALTNVVLHAPGAAATVQVRHSAGLVEIEVHDDGGTAAGGTSHGGPAPAAPDAGRTGRGHGQLGMRERVAAWGGTLTVGPQAGGYRVHATLPYRPEEAGA